MPAPADTRRAPRTADGGERAPWRGWGAAESPHPGGGKGGLRGAALARAAPDPRWSHRGLCGRARARAVSLALALGHPHDDCIASLIPRPRWREAATKECDIICAHVLCRRHQWATRSSPPMSFRRDFSLSFPRDSCTAAPPTGSPARWPKVHVQGRRTSARATPAPQACAPVSKIGASVRRSSQHAGPGGDDLSNLDERSAVRHDCYLVGCDPHAN